MSPYDWNGLERSGANNDRLAYYEDGTLRSRLGVDVSDHQGVIDWNAVAADGIDFAMVRVGNRGYTEGTLYADERYAENIDNATSAGLDVGAYFFSQAVSVEEAREEADFVLELLAGRLWRFPWCTTTSPYPTPGPREQPRSRDAHGQRAGVLRALGAGAATPRSIYGNSGDMARYNRADLGEHPVWFAEYDAAEPHGQFDFVMWQYTNAGTVNGISTAVDLNLLLTELRNEPRTQLLIPPSHQARSVSWNGSSAW